MGPRTRLLVSTTAILFVFLAVYVPAVGHGFIKDDVVWILGSRIHSSGDIWRLFTSDNGFYRPIVSLTFSLDAWLAPGAGARIYGLTNVVLALLCFGSIHWMARGLHLSSGAALLAGALWLMNFNGIGGSMLWISGRTYFLVTLMAALTAGALVRGRVLLAAFLLVVALFTKEEALLLPVVLAGWLIWLRAGRNDRTLRPVATWALISVGAVALYLFARSYTHAMTPANAPAYYQPLLSIVALISNIRHYAEWTLTFSCLVALLGLALLGVPRPFLDTRTRTIILCGSAWIIGGLGLTVFVPSRSVDYAVLPSAGAGLACAAILERAWTLATPIARQRTFAAAMAFVVLLGPVHYLRSVTMRSIADLSADTLASLPSLTAGLPEDATVVISEDPRNARVNLEAAFGTLLDDAYRLTTGQRLTFRIEPPVHDAADLRLVRREGRLERK